MFVHLQNTGHGHVPDYFQVPLSSYNTEVCFVTRDGVVAAPRLLIRTVFPDFDSLLCPSCVEGHERVTIIIKDVSSGQMEEAFKHLARGDPEFLAVLLQLRPLEPPSRPSSSELALSEVFVKEEPAEAEEEVQETSELIENKEGILETGALVICDQCEYVFPNDEELKNHKTDVHKLEEDLFLLKCNACDFKASYYQALKIHKEKEHGLVSKKFPCKKCKYVARSKARLEMHMSNCVKETLEEEVIEDPTNNDPDLSCNICDFQAKTQMKLFKHVQRTHQSGNESTSVAALQQDTNTEAELKIRNFFICKYCQFEVKKRTQLKRHISTEHPNKFYKCNKCDFETKHKTDYLKHLRQHLTNEKYQCTECEYKCKSKTLLSQHQVSEHRTFFCDICDKKFRKETILQAHKDKDHPQNCEVCGIEFNNKKLVKEHLMAVHSIHQMSECKFCNKLFPEKELRSHYNYCDQKPSVTGENWQSCQYCSLRQRNITNHERVCVYKDRVIKGYQGSRLFQDDSFGWL